MRGRSMSNGDDKNDILKGSATYKDYDESVARSINEDIGKEFVHKSPEKAFESTVKQTGYRAFYSEPYRQSVGAKSIERQNESEDNGFFAGAAGSATYKDHTQDVIKPNIRNIGKEFVRDSVDTAVKTTIVKSSNTSYSIKTFSRDKTSGRLYSFTRETIESETAHCGENGGITDRVSGKTAKHTLRTPLYARDTGKTAVMVWEGGRYSYKTVRDIRNNTISSEEARIATLKKGKDILKSGGKAAISSTFRAVDEFEGSDDLGIDAITKPKDAIIKTDRTVKVTSRAVKSIAETPTKTQKAMRDIQKVEQKIKQSVASSVRTIKSVTHSVANPAVRKSLSAAGLMIVMVGIIVAGASAVTCLFSGFTYPSGDADLTATYTYVTELDVNLEECIKEIPSDPKWADVKVSINAFSPKTDPVGIISYLTAKYREFKFNDDIKSEIEEIHKEMYKVNYKEWVEEIEHSETITNPDGTTASKTWIEEIPHLDVELEYTPFNIWVEMHKDEMEASVYEQYAAYNSGISGTAQREEIGSVFIDEKVSISDRFGYRIDPFSGEKAFHSGIDIPMPTGTPINAGINGVATVGYDAEGFGKYVTIACKDVRITYAHCNAILVRDKDTVIRGEEIATVGSTGKSMGSHVHIEVEKDGKKLNPLFYINSSQFLIAE